MVWTAGCPSERSLPPATTTVGVGVVVWTAGPTSAATGLTGELSAMVELVGGGVCAVVWMVELVAGLVAEVMVGFVAMAPATISVRSS